MSADSRELVFLSYSHAAPEWRDRLLILLKPFVRQGQLEVWADSYILAGADWRREIDDALARTTIGVVLLSPELLASDFIIDTELPLLLRAAEAGAIRLLIVPIEAHAKGSTRVQTWDLTDFQWPWPPEAPLAELSQDRRNRALVTVTEAIVAALQRPTTPTTQSHDRTRLQPLPSSGAMVGELHGVPELPPNYVPWSEAHEEVKSAVLGRVAVVGVTTSHKNIGVHGQGGRGKTVVVQGLVRDDDVRRAFPDGIYWITVGQQPNIEALLSGLLGFMRRPVTFDSATEATTLLRERLRGKACLLVLDDVWQLSHASIFDVLEGESRLLITTRDRGILTDLAAEDVELDALPEPLALTLLARWAGTEVTGLPPLARDLAEKVDYLPLALSLIGAQIHDGRTWEEILEAVERGDLIYLDHPYGSVFKCIQTSVDALPQFEAARYVELAVFPEDEEIPLAVVADLWCATAALDSTAAVRLAKRLASLNLLRIVENAVDGPDGQARIALHDLHADFVRLLAHGVPGLHAALIEQWRTQLTREFDVEGPDAWASLQPLPAYRRQHLTYHLHLAGMVEELGAVLTSAEWLYMRFMESSLPQLLGDFRQVRDDRGLRLVRNALVLSKIPMTRDSSAMPGQLAGRLINSRDSRIQSLLAKVPRALRNRPMLLPTVGCLTSPGRELRQLFQQYRVEVLAIAMMPDGERAVSGGSDGALTIWELGRGSVAQTLEGKSRGIRAITALGDGRTVAAGTDQGFLTIWNVDTGKILHSFEAHSSRISAIGSIENDQRLVTVSHDETVKEWDTQTGTLLSSSIVQGEAITALAILPDETELLIGFHDGKVATWNRHDTNMIRQMGAHKGRITALASLGGGRTVLSGSRDGTVRQWQLPELTPLQTYRAHRGNVTAVAATRNGNHVVCAGDDKTVRLWDSRSGETLSTFYDEVPITSLSVWKDSRIVAGNAFGGILVLSVR